MRRLYSASDVRRYARCPRQWWYETRGDELGALTPPEIARRLDALRRRYGAAAHEQPAYRLLADLAAREERLAHGREVHHTHARRALRPLGCLPLAGLVVVTALLLLLLLAPRYI